MPDNIDYKSIWIKWIALNQAETKDRKDLLQHFHIEITKGFDVITRIAGEEIFIQTPDLSSQKENIQISLSFLVYSGYLLYLIGNNINPTSSELVSKSSTNELGNNWMDNHIKDQSLSLFEKIDPVFSLFMEKEAFAQATLLLTDEGFQNISYANGLKKESYYSWAIHQGFILGILENE